MEEVEPPVGLDVEDEVVLLGRLVGQAAADLEAGGVQQHVDVAAGLADARDDRLDGLAVGEVDGVVVGPAPGRLDGLQRAQRRRARSIRASSWSTSTGVARSPAAFSRSKIVRLRSVLVGGEGADVRVGRVGLRGPGRAGGTCPARPGRGRR